MVACEFRKIYVTVNKVGVDCTKNGGERRITCELVCLECDCGKNFPQEDIVVLAHAVPDYLSV